MTHDSRGRLAVDLGGAWRLYWGNGPLPSGAQALGTVTRGSGDTGALLRTDKGIYAQGNAGSLRTLDQRKIEASIEQSGSARGGSRAGAGKPASDGARGMRRVNVMLDDEADAIAKRYGIGDRSAGIRIALKRLAKIDSDQ